MAKVKIVKTIEPYWNELVEIWFLFCIEKFNEKPTFDGSSPRDLKSIIASLKKRSEDSGKDWTYEAATMRLKGFLNYAFQDRWLSENWMLYQINRQKDRVFFNMAKNRLNGSLQ